MIYIYALTLIYKVSDPTDISSFSLYTNWTSLRGEPGREASKTEAEWSTSG